MDAEVRAFTVDDDRIPLNDGRPGAEEYRRDVAAVHDRRGSENPVVAARLMVVRKTTIVETVVAEHDRVRPETRVGHEIRALDEHVLVVALFGIADAAERR